MFRQQTGDMLRLIAKEAWYPHCILCIFIIKRRSTHLQPLKFLHSAGLAGKEKERFRWS